MSFRVLVIPEDPTHNGYILKPLVSRLLEEAGKPNAKILVLTNPKLNGYQDAVAAVKGELKERYGHFDLWLFMPDADCAGGLSELEAEVGKSEIKLLCCAAQPEVEAWLMAGHRDKLDEDWGAVRSHPKLKEEVFVRFLKKHGYPFAAGSGREKLMLETLQNYRGLLQICPELADLQKRLTELLK